MSILNKDYEDLEHGVDVAKSEVKNKVDSIQAKAEEFVDDLTNKQHILELHHNEINNEPYDEHIIESLKVLTEGKKKKLTEAKSSDVVYFPELNQLTVYLGSLFEGGTGGKHSAFLNLSSTWVEAEYKDVLCEYGELADDFRILSEVNASLEYYKDGRDLVDIQPNTSGETTTSIVTISNKRVTIFRDVDTDNIDCYIIPGLAYPKFVINILHKMIKYLNHDDIMGTFGTTMLRYSDEANNFYRERLFDICGEGDPDARYEVEVSGVDEPVRLYACRENPMIITVTKFIDSQDFKDMTAAFCGCSSLQRIADLPEDVELLDYCFERCSDLAGNINIPSSVTSLRGTFMDCETIDCDIVVPRGVKDVSYMLDGCVRFNSRVELHSDIEKAQYTFFGCEVFRKDIMIPKALKTADGMFGLCVNFNSAVSLPDGLQSANEMFVGCRQFSKSIYVPASIEKHEDMFGGIKCAGQIIQLPPSAKAEEYGIGPGINVIKHSGSEIPRENIATAMSFDEEDLNESTTAEVPTVKCIPYDDFIDWFDTLTPTGSVAVYLKTFKFSETEIRNVQDENSEYDSLRQFMYDTVNGDSSTGTAYEDAENVGIDTFCDIYKQVCGGSKEEAAKYGVMEYHIDRALTPDPFYDGLRGWAVAKFNK